MDARALRLAVREGRHRGLTTGHAAGFVQCNLAVVPQDFAPDFIAFCQANALACPVVGVSRAGETAWPALGADIDIRTDLPGYVVHRAGHAVRQVDSLLDIWRDDLVAVALGCWFSMEDALAAAGVRLRHVELGIQGPLFKTVLPAAPAGRFAGPLVVSMRPFATAEVATVRAVTARFPRVHGAPLYEGTGAAAKLGIRDIAKPDYGEPIPLAAGDVPLYWGCGLTAVAALEQAGLPLFITHAPGKMLVTDLANASLLEY
jgi:uncharacterized protein YcsI (UPF0317 family)